jgi:hypothetical protein
MSANRSTRDQSQFVNGLIQRKAFSWTRVFEDLELVMPPNLHVVSLRPELNEQNQMELEMRVAGDNRSAAVELVHRMEGSKHFQGAQLVSRIRRLGERIEHRHRCGGRDLCSRARGSRLGSKADSKSNRSKIMPDLGNSRRKLKIAIGAMLAADVIAVGVLFSPLVGSAESRNQQLNQQNRTAEEKPRGSAAARHGQKDRVAKDQIGDFYKDRFAASDSELLNELGKLATENGVPMQHMSTTRKKTRKPPA